MDREAKRKKTRLTKIYRENESEREINKNRRGIEAEME